MKNILISSKKILSNQIVFNFFYYLIHSNIIFGYIHKKFFNYFSYKNYLFFVKNINIPLSHYSSFFFKTYEINDRILLEKFLTKKNKCLIIGAGIGFTSVISYKITKNIIFCFEINKKLKPILFKNFLLNKVKYKLFFKNLVFKKNSKKIYFESKENFLENNIYNKGKTSEIENLFFKKIPMEKLNTLIIDAEGYEYEILKNLNKLKKISYIFFELHPKLLNKKKQKEIFKILKANRFKKELDFLNSYYFKKI